MRRELLADPEIKAVLPSVRELLGGTQMITLRQGLTLLALALPPPCPLIITLVFSSWECQSAVGTVPCTQPAISQEQCPL